MSGTAQCVFPIFPAFDRPRFWANRVDRFFVEARMTSSNAFRPDAFRPDSAAQTADAVRQALSEGQPLEIVGHGSKRGFGRPVQAALALDMSDMAGIVAYEPEELVLTVRPGTPMAEVETLLAGHRQHLAFEPADPGPLYGVPAGAGTVGGTLAAGLAGPRRIKDGGARDHFLGMEGINGRGEIFKAGGKVVKNVTGYDVCKLMAGSFGTLTVFTEVTVKVLPAPEEVRTLVLTGLDPRSGVAALTRALHSPYDVSGAAHLPAGAAARSGVAAVAAAGGPVTLVRLEGFGPSVAARATALSADLEVDGVLDHARSVAVWREIRDVAALVPPSATLWKLSVPPSAGPAVAAALCRMLAAEAGLAEAELAKGALAKGALAKGALAEGALAEAIFDWGGGLVWLAVDPRLCATDTAGAVRAAVAPTGGHATLVRAPVDIRATVPVFPSQPEPLARLAARVKESFDPMRLFNPGRMTAGV
jgi:glycolate oxidase FAD binding subunit